jgi:hypothetical protein
MTGIFAFYSTQKRTMKMTADFAFYSTQKRNTHSQISVQCYKTFYIVAEDEAKEARTFVAGKPIQPGIKSDSKATAYLIEEAYRHSPNG